VKPFKECGKESNPISLRRIRLMKNTFLKEANVQWPEIRRYPPS
jgi:hypothetical protein